MKLAIVGSTRFVNPFGEAVARNVIEGLVGGLYLTDTVVSGGAVGVDSWAAEAAETAGISVKEFIPLNKRWAPHGYQERNLLIAQECDALVRIYCAESRTYGSGWTADRAFDLGKPVIMVKVPANGVLVEISTRIENGEAEGNA